MENAKKSKMIFEKTLTVIAWVCFVLAIIMSSFSIGAALSGEENGKEIFGHKILIVNSDSMSKSQISEKEKIHFTTGDVIVIRVIDKADGLKVGDVITFTSYNPGSLGKTVTHKIRDIKYSDSGAVTGIVTYGINTGVNDLVEVKPEHVLGKYVFKMSKVGKLFAFLKTPRGYYLSILIPLVLLIMFFSGTIGKVIGRQEFAKRYNEEMESLKKRLDELERKELKMTTENTINENENMQQAMEENKEQSAQTATAQQPTPVICQTINITYQPWQQAPIIYQTAPSLNVPTYQTVSIVPPPGMPQPVMMGQPVICQTTGNAPAPVAMQPVVAQAPAPVVQPVVVSSQPVVCQTVGDAPAPVAVQPAPEQPQPVPEQPQPVPEQPQPAPEQPQPAPEQPQPAPEQPQPAPEQPQPAPEQSQPVSEQETVATVVNDEPVVENDDDEDDDGKLDIPEVKKKSFSEKIVEAKEETQEYFNTIHNELVSYKKVKSRVSFRAMSYRSGRTLLAKIGLRGKTLNCYFNLNVKDFNENVFFQKDMSSKKAYEEVPFAVKVKSKRACVNATKLVNEVASKFELQKNSKFEASNVIKELKSE